MKNVFYKFYTSVDYQGIFTLRISSSTVWKEVI